MPSGSRAILARVSASGAPHQIVDRGQHGIAAALVAQRLEALAAGLDGGDLGAEIGHGVAGMRTFLRMMPSSCRSNSPRLISLIGGSTRPSWKISVASGGRLPIAIPPMSDWCAMLTESATGRPCQMTGVRTVMSGMWVPPS